MLRATHSAPQLLAWPHEKHQWSKIGHVYDVQTPDRRNQSHNEWDDPEWDDADLPTAETGSGRGWRPAGTDIVVLLGLFVLVAQFVLTPNLNWAPLQTWSTIFTAISLQSIPFLVLGVVLSALVAVVIPAGFFRKLLPKNPVLAVCTAGVGGMALPGCECASVPVSASLVRRGVAPAAALTFMLAAPAINPVVLVATAVAFQGTPEMVGARFLASLALSITMGLIWLKIGRSDLLQLPRIAGDESASMGERFRAAAVHDIFHAGGFLIVGAAVAATMNVVLPKSVMQFLADHPFIAVIALALLAVAVSMCSEADAFVAASFSQLGPAAQLAFMVVGPAIDIKLVAMQWGTFGRRFTMLFAPITFVLAIIFSLVVSAVLL